MPSWLGSGFLLISLLGFGCAPSEPSPVQFVDETRQAGLSRKTPTYDAAIADIDGDGDPDIYVGNHEYAAALLRNDGRRFEDRIGPSGIDPMGDQHGTAWTDIDNDGHVDLFVSLGAFRGQGSKENLLYRNRGDGTFARQPAPIGVEDPTGRSRSTASLDFDNDGWLDLLVSNHGTPSRLFRNLGGRSFEDVSEDTGVLNYPAETVTWSDYDADGYVDLLFMQGPRGARLLRNEAGVRFVDVTESAGLDPWASVGGAAFGDYDNDGAIDLYLSSGWSYRPSAWSDEKGEIRFALFGKGSTRGFDFEAEGADGSEIRAELFQRGSPALPDQILCGRETRPKSHDFVCGGADAIASTSPEVALGFVLWREPGSRRDCETCPEIFRWHLRWHGEGDWNETGTIFGGVRPELVGVATGAPGGGTLYRNLGNGTFTRVTPPGLDPDVNGQGAFWADLNADGWLDLYVVDAGADGAPSRSQLFLNNGNGGFRQAPAESGATPLISEGRPTSVQRADFDRDGKIDLFLTNGWGAPPFNRGPYLFLRNTSKSANWLEVRLEGVASNRPGLGARIDLEACGMHQMRIHDGARSDLSQSLALPHFGLGDCDQVDSLQISWPSGRKTRLERPEINGVVSSRESPPPDVILIVIDTLRAKSLSLYDYARDTSPEMIEFSKDAILYENAISPGTWTVPAHGSLFTGRLPSYHGAERVAPNRVIQATPLNPDVPTLAELLRNEGWATGAFVANSTFVTPSLGFARGFDPFVADDIRANLIITAALDWFAEQASPTFLFLNILDPHEPYDPGEPYRSRFPGREDSYGNKITDLFWDNVELTAPVTDHFRSQYDGEISWTDEVLGELFDRLRGLDRYDESLIIVTSDHGELLGEHGLAGHGISTYQEIVHVPLLVKRPGNAGAGSRRAQRVSTMGAFAEVLAAAGIPAPKGTQAVRLDEPHPVWVEDIDFNGDRVTVGFEGPAKLVQIYGGGYEKLAQLFDLASDPDENRPLDPSHEQELKSRANLHRDRPRPTHDLPPPVVDPERERRLRQLGYVQ